MGQELSPLFIESVEKELADITDPRRLVEALAETEPVVSVRFNRRKPSVLSWEGMEPVRWCDNGYYLPQRPKFTLIPELHQGRFYVQDASSMFIRSAIRQLCDGDSPLVYLDACAAPGGKTTAAIDALPEGSLMVANEYDSRRAAVLRENLTKWGYPDLIVTQGDTAVFRKTGAIFNIIAADVPCSGEGMMRKDAEAARQWSPSLVNECAERQREIVANLWDALLPGGYLIYSTCTFNKFENERMVEWIADTLGARTVELRIPEESGILLSKPREDMFCYRFMPHLLRGEGLFMAVLRKDGDAVTAGERKKDKGKSAKVPPAVNAVKGWVKDGDGYEIMLNNDLVTLFPRKYIPLLELLHRKARVIQSGVAVATLKGKDLIPEHPLALSTLFNIDAFPHVELTLEDALAYLRRDAITLPEGTPRGFVALVYNGAPLGFVKNLGNRSNNLYPQNWKILMRGI